MAAEPFSAAALAINAATPFVSRALGSLFGVKSAEEEERARIEAAMAPFQRVAEGGTTQGQAGLAYARGRALSDLAAMAQRGTAQQQAGMQREAMRQGADVQAQYASQLAELRAREQQRARMAVSQGQIALSEVAAKDAKRKRDELAGFIGGTLGMATKAFVPGGGTGGTGSAGEKLTEDEAKAYNQAQFAVRKDPFAAWNARQPEADPFAAVQESTLTGNEMTGGGLAGGGVAGGQFAFQPENERANLAANIASPGRMRSRNPTLADATASAAPAQSSALSDLGSVTSTIGALPGPKPFGGSTFSAPEVMPSTLEKSIYKDQLAGPGPAGAATSPDMAPAPIGMSGFGGMSAGTAPTPEEPSRWQKYKARSPKSVRGRGGLGL